MPADMNVNIWDVSDAIRALVSSDRLAGTAMLADVDVPLTEVCPDAAGRGRSFGRRAGLKPRSAV